MTYFIFLIQILGISQKSQSPHLRRMNPPMNVGQKGIELIKEFEGCQLTAYKLGDGMITIGWGHAEKESDTNLVAGVTKWTQHQADMQLWKDAQRAVNGVNNYFTRSFNQNQFDALVSFAYNLGPNVFSNYSWGKTETDQQICERMILYVYPEIFRVGLTRRRKAEIALYNTPTGSRPQPQPKPQLQPQSPTGKTLEKIASEVLNGIHGNGEQRAASLGQFYTGVQAIVNERCQVITTSKVHEILAKETWKGVYGNDQYRKDLLGSYYYGVQSLINSGFR